MTATKHDPLAHVQANDRPDPTPNIGPYCKDEHGGYTCTREPGHPGQHIAGGYTYVCEVWPR